VWSEVLGSLAQASDKPRVLIVRGRQTSKQHKHVVVTAVEPVAEVASETDYMRAARNAGLPWYSEQAYYWVLREQNVKIAIAVETINQRKGTIRLVYRDGKTGDVLTSQTVPHIDRSASLQRTIAKQLSSLLSGEKPERPEPREPVTAPSEEAPETGEPAEARSTTEQEPPESTQETESGEPSESDATEELEDESEDSSESERSAVFNAFASGGVGIGLRTLRIPSNLGFRLLDLNAFPTAGVFLGFQYITKALADIAYHFQIDYRTSVGLGLEDLRGDGTVRETQARVQRWEVEAGFAYQKASQRKNILLGAGFGWGMEIFGATQAISVPDFTLTGPFIRPRIALPFWDGGFVFTLAPEAALILVDDALQTLGASSLAVGLGANANVLVQLSNVLNVELSYRHAQTLLSASGGGSASDVAQWLLLRLTYTP